MVQINKFSTVFMGQTLIILQSVDSTNTFLKQGVANSEPYPSGTVIMAVHQYAGRGQQNHVWQSKAGENLTFSLLLQPEDMSLSQQFDLNKCVCLAIADTLKSYLPHEVVKVKWPNDVLVNGKKICGVLIENMSKGTKLKHSVIGIGLNVNQTQFAPDIAHKVSSLKLLHGAEFSLLSVLEKICLHLEHRWEAYLQGQTKSLHESYMNLLYQFGQETGYRQNGRFFVGTITNVTDDGQLEVKTDDGLKSFGFKEIEFII